MENLTSLIAVYNRVLRLKEILLGDEKECREEGGRFAIFEGLYNIIEHAASAEIRLLEEDEAFEKVTEILGRNAMQCWIDLWSR